jgi:hypothetical protein
MRRRLFLAIVALAGWLLLTSASLIRPQEDPSRNPFKPQQGETAQPNAANDKMEGLWTEIYSESGGGFFSTMETKKVIQHLMDFPGRGGTVLPEQVIKVSQEAIEAGWDDKDFPTIRFSYKLTLGGVPGTIDMTLLESADRKLVKGKDGVERIMLVWEKPKQAKTDQGIYLLKDDFLIMAFGEKDRAKRFGAPNTVRIYRRGKLK